MTPSDPSRIAGHLHGARKPRMSSGATRDHTASLFRALGDPERLRLVEMLSDAEWCVSELAEAVGGEPTVMSQRLRVLRHEGLVQRRRSGRHIFYRLADAHVADMVRSTYPDGSA